MFTKYDKSQINRMLEKAQRYVQSFRTQSGELQELWQEIVHLQVKLDRIETREE